MTEEQQLKLQAFLDGELPEDPAAFANRLNRLVVGGFSKGLKKPRDTVVGAGHSGAYDVGKSTRKRRHAEQIRPRH